MTPAQQAAWTAFAASYPVVDSLGQSITLTGQQYFVAINSQLLNVGAPTIVNPPTNTTVNPVAPVTIYADAGGAFIVGFTAPTTGDYVLVAQSKLLSGGVSFNKTFTQAVVVASSVGFADLSTTFAAQWGALVVGRKVFARIQPVNSDGMFLPGVIAQTVVVPATSLTAPAAATSTGGTTSYTFAPTSADSLILESAPTAGGPWSLTDALSPVTSPQVMSTPGATTWYRARFYATGSWSPFSSAQVGS